MYSLLKIQVVCENQVCFLLFIVFANGICQKTNCTNQCWLLKSLIEKQVTQTSISNTKILTHKPLNKRPWQQPTRYGEVNRFVNVVWNCHVFCKSPNLYIFSFIYSIIIDKKVNNIAYIFRITIIYDYTTIKWNISTR